MPTAASIAACRPMLLGDKTGIVRSMRLNQSDGLCAGDGSGGDSIYNGTFNDEKKVPYTGVLGSMPMFALVL